MLIWHSSR